MWNGQGSEKDTVERVKMGKSYTDTHDDEQRQWSATPRKRSIEYEKMVFVNSHMMPIP